MSIVFIFSKSGVFNHPNDCLTVTAGGRESLAEYDVDSP